jgi:16S rRNA (cytosine967-C5)-methyltransferase
MATGPNRASDSGKRPPRATSGHGRRRPRQPASRSRSRPAPQTARLLALGVIRRVVEGDAYSNLALSAALKRSRLGDRDRRLATDLAYGTLRRLLPLDAEIREAAGRAPASIDLPVLAALRLGAYQIRFTRIPAHAAVGETVALVPERARGFANAVLRRLAGEVSPAIEGDDDDAVSRRTGLAAWAVAELRRVLPAGEVEPAAAALAEPSALCLRVNTCRAGAASVEEELRNEGLDPAPGTHHPDAIRIRPADPSALPAFAAGRVTVQEEASILVGTAVEAEPGERVLDVCAGPGGKASHLACRVQPNGLAVAADVSATRAALVRATAARLGVPLLVLAQDGRRPALRPVFDAVLVDAPCSGIGAARRRPELLWRPRREELARLARLQVEILCGAADVVGPGGRLVYSVCTFPRAETEAAVRAFLAKREDFEPAAIPGPGGRTPEHRLWPHREGTDAMFFAGFRRRNRSSG